MKIEINKDAGNCPKLGGTADKHIRPCHGYGRAFCVLVKGGFHEAIL